MRALLGLLPMPGCGLDVVGTWQVDAMSVGGVEIDDAGFIDIRTNGDVASGVPNAVLLRSWWDPESVAWEPDPTPFVQTASFDLFAYQDDPGSVVALTLALPAGPDRAEPAGSPPDIPRSRRSTAAGACHG